MSRTKTEIELFQAALEAWGKEAQLRMLQEECAELIHAVSKHIRGAPDNIAEEIADVDLMLSEIKRLFPHYAEIREQKLEKLENLLRKDFWL